MWKFQEPSKKKEKYRNLHRGMTEDQRRRKKKQTASKMKIKEVLVKEDRSSKEGQVSFINYSMEVMQGI